jgi:hypothetical protein
MKDKIIVTKLTRTCRALPAQWDGWTDDGYPLYFRYRWGWLQVAFKPGDYPDDPFLELQLGHEYHGAMTEAELVAALEPHGFRFDVNLESVPLDEMIYCFNFQTGEITKLGGIVELLEHMAKMRQAE